MSNELKDIADRLSRYSGDGWEITQAAKNEGESWNLKVQRIETPQEATDEDN